MVNLLQVDPIELEFGYGIIPLADVNQGGIYLTGCYDKKAACIGFGNDSSCNKAKGQYSLEPNQYVIKIKGVELAGGELMLDHYLAMSPEW